MSYTIKITKEVDNVLIQRKEIEFTINHPESGTPNRVDVKKKIAALKTADENLVFVKSIKSAFGSKVAKGTAAIYKDAERMKHFEPDYMRIRIMAKEHREEERKKVKEAKKKKSTLKGE